MAWNQSTGEAAKPTPKKPSALRGVIAGVAVVAAAVAVFFVLSGKDEKPKAKVEKEKPEAQIKEVKPAKAAVYKEEAPKEDPRKARMRELRERAKNMTPEEKQELRREIARNMPLDLTPTTNHPFRTGTELQMARIFMTEPGDPPPPFFPMPIRDEEQLAQILIANNPVIEGDSEQVKEAKKVVELAKKEMRQYIKDGGDPQEFLQYYHSKLVSARDERMMYAREIVRVAKEDPTIARQFYDEANRKLEEKGIKTVVIPPKARKILGLED